MFTNQEYQVSTQANQKRFVKIELMNWEEEIIDEISGLATGGNISIDSSSLIRRNCDITFVIDNSKLIPSSDSKIWLNKKFKLLVGIENEITNEIVWFNKGIYILDKPSLKYSLSTKELSIHGLDKFCWLDGTLNGKLQNYKTKINADTPIFQAVKSLVLLSGENTNKILITDTENFKVPYDIEKLADDTIGDFLIVIRNLYLGFEMFYDENGNFIFQMIKDRKNDMITFDFNKVPFIIDYSNEPNFENVKNDIEVWGAELEDGTQIKYHMQNTDESNPFSIQNLGETKKDTLTDEKIQTSQQAEMRAKYELFLHGNLAEKISFSSVPIYGLDVNNLIKVTKEDIGINGNYKINRISLPLTSDGSMSINATKMYYDTV